MKKTFLVVAIITVLYSCGGNSAKNTAENIQTSVKEHTPGSIATSAGGYSMKAKINGKDWEADEMMPQDASGRILGSRNKESISIPYDRRDMVVGNKRKFGETYGVDLFLNDEVGIWGGRKGEMEITNVDDKSAEGKFFFTATANGTDKIVEVTDGTFRILFSAK